MGEQAQLIATHVLVENTTPIQHSRPTRARVVRVVIFSARQEQLPEKRVRFVQQDLSAAARVAFSALLARQEDM